MAEYIEREKLIEHLRKDPLFDLVERYGITGVIESIPAADVRPVKRGRWIQTTQPMGWRDEDCAECSVCGEDFVLDELAMEDFTNLMNFCPNCGADMREPPKGEE